MIMSDKFIKKQFHAAHQHLLSQGLNPRDIAREQRTELMVPKLALVGVFQTLETFCDAGKTTVMSSAGPLDTRSLLLFLGALKKSVDLGERLLVDYQNAQNAIKAMEIATELAEQEIEENSDPQDDQDTVEYQNKNDQDQEDSTEEQEEFDIRKLN